MATTIRSFTDTMMSVKNFEKQIEFYTNFLGLSIVHKVTGYALLKDNESGQVLCITDGESVASVSPGITTANLEDSLAELNKLGGSVVKRWEYSDMIGANCKDPEGNELMIWQLKN